MMSKFKVPKFLSKRFNSATEEKRANLITSYKTWYNEDVTDIWIEGFKIKIEELIKEEEALTPSTSFEFQHQVITNRAERLLLRSLIKEMDYKL
tara:strand:+ start:278 stop:559 length:282 start_codon:yes stop_codon:yes gene_type:complete